MSGHAHHQADPSPRQGFWRGRGSMAILAFVIVAATYLAFEHTTHAIRYLPVALLLLCPLMHVLMHRRHGGHGGGSRSGDGR